MIEDITVDSDERGFVLELVGDFDDAIREYELTDGRLVLRLSQDTALKLVAQAREHIQPWADTMMFERDAFNRASQEEREAVLHGLPQYDRAEALLEAADHARKADRERGHA